MPAAYDEGATHWRVPCITMTQTLLSDCEGSTSRTGKGGRV